MNPNGKCSKTNMSDNSKCLMETVCLTILVLFLYISGNRGSFPLNLALSIEFTGKDLDFSGNFMKF